MTRDEAEGIWGLIVAVYGLHPERAGEDSKAWIPALEEMDAEPVMVIVDAWMHGNGPEKMPSLVAFAGEVRRLVERRREDAKPAAVLAEGQPIPAWYIAWGKLRDNGDQRRLPEQEGGFVQMGYEWPGTVKVRVTTMDGIVEEERPIEIIVGEEYDRLIAEAEAVEQTLPPVWVDPDPECILCVDQGLVEVGWETRLARVNGVSKMVRQGEQIAPCPRCERGKSVEFPLETVGPWGPEGFWRGRKWKVVRSGVVEVTV